MKTLAKWSALTLGCIYVVLFYFSTESAAYRQKTPIEEFVMEVPKATADSFPSCTIDVQSPCSAGIVISEITPKATAPVMQNKKVTPVMVSQDVAARDSLSPFIDGHLGDGWTAKRVGVDVSDRESTRRQLKISFLYPLASYTFTSSVRDITKLRSLVIEFDSPTKFAKHLSIEFYHGAELVGSVPLLAENSTAQSQSFTIPTKDINIRGNQITDIRMRSNGIGSIGLTSVLLLMKDENI